jgi:hypothetical protein
MGGGSWCDHHRHRRRSGVAQLRSCTCKFFSLSLMPVAVGKAKVDGWAREARRAMPLDVGKMMQKVCIIFANDQRTTAQSRC